MKYLQMLLNGDTEEIVVSNKSDFALIIDEADVLMKYYMSSMGDSYIISFLLSSIEGIVDLQNYLLSSYLHSGVFYDELPEIIKICDKKLSLEMDALMNILESLYKQEISIKWLGKLPFTISYGITNITQEHSITKRREELYNETIRRYGPYIDFYAYQELVFSIPILISESLIHQTSNNIGKYRYIQYNIRRVKQLYKVVKFLQNILHEKIKLQIKITQRSGILKIGAENIHELLEDIEKRSDDFVTAKTGSIYNISEVSLEYQKAKQATYNIFKRIGKENREEIRNGLEIIFKNIPNIDLIVKSELNLEFSIFKQIIHTLIDLSYNELTNCVLVEELKLFKDDIFRNLSISPNDKRVIIKLIQNFGILRNGYFYSSHYYFVYKIEEFLHKLSLKSPTKEKGDQFESYVYDELTNNFFNILEQNLDIKAQYLPTKISLRLFGRIKINSEIDIIAYIPPKENLIFIISDKYDSKFSKKRSFETHAEDWFYLSRFYVEERRSIIGVPIITTNLNIKEIDHRKYLSYLFPIRILTRELRKLSNSLTNDTIEAKRGLLYPQKGKDMLEFF